MRPWSPILPCWSPSRTQRKDCRAGHKALATALPGGWYGRNGVQRNPIISICRVN